MAGVLGACCLWSAASAQAPVPAGAAADRYALVIGNDDYWHRQLLPRLDNAARDARALADKLARELGFRVVLKTDVERKVIIEELLALAANLKRKPNAVGLFYFAGHGMQLDGRNYLAGVDAKLDSAALVPDVTVSAERVIDEMVGARNRLNMVVLDACRDNAFQPAGPPRGAAPGASPPTRPPFSVKTGLASMQVPSTGGRALLVAFAAGAGERGAAGGPGENSLFAGALLSALDEPGLSAPQTFDRTRVAVSRRSGGRQSPFVAVQGTDDFRFRQGASAPLVAAAKGGEEDDWRKVMDSKSLERWEWFLGRHPDGRHRAEAAARLAALKADREELAMWEGAQKTNDPEELELFLQMFPRGNFAGFAERRLRQLRANNPPELALAPLAIEPEKRKSLGGAKPAAAKPASPAAPAAKPADRAVAARPLPSDLPPIGMPPGASDGSWTGTLERAEATPEERHLCRPGKIEFQVEQSEIVGGRVTLDDQRSYDLDLASKSLYRASVEGTLPGEGAVKDLVVRLFNEVNTNFTSYRFQGTIEDDRFTGTWRLDGYGCRGSFQFTRAAH
ncbi:MAG: caspase family protein [Alphaproteobacteria bacterium]|nr:caspase family protein [Alphaproteobacteria bacterium]